MFHHGLFLTGKKLPWCHPLDSLIDQLTYQRTRHGKTQLFYTKTNCHSTVLKRICVTFCSILPEQLNLYTNTVRTFISFHLCREPTYLQWSETVFLTVYNSKMLPWQSATVLSLWKWATIYFSIFVISNYIFWYVNAYNRLLLCNSIFHRYKSPYL